MRARGARAAVLLDGNAGARSAHVEKFAERVGAGEQAVGDQPEPVPDRAEAEAVRHFVQHDVGEDVEAHGVDVDDVELHRRRGGQRAVGADRRRPGLAEDAVEPVDIAELGGDQDVVDRLGPALAAVTVTLGSSPMISVVSRSAALTKML